MKPLRDYQLRGIDGISQSFRKGHKKIVLCMATGSGKCHGIGTPILMFDGTIKNVEEVLTGDLVMGPDSKQRLVTGTTRGYGELFRITPVRGESYIVNADHVLSLKRTRIKAGGEKGMLVNISVRDYLLQSKHFKHLHKGWRSSVDWPEKEVPLDPYFFGLWLADGNANVKTVAITKPDFEVAECVRNVADSFGMKYVTSTNSSGCPSHRISRSEISGPNKIAAILRLLGVDRNKHIPLIYLANSREIRLAVLAGILDGDGHYHNGGYDFISKRKEISEGVCFLARSLGLAAYMKQCVKTCQNNFSGSYYRVSVSGDCSIIPCRISRKQAAQRKQIKDHLVTGIKAEPIGKGEYFGFEVDQDHLYLLGDFTVTHNSKTAMGMIKRALDRKKKVLFLCDRNILIDQFSSEASEWDLDHGLIRKGGFTDRLNPFVIASKKTFMSLYLTRQRFEIPNYDLLVVDKAHRGGSAEFQKIFQCYPDSYRIGLTATPIRPNGETLGPDYTDLICPIQPSQLLANGYLVPARCFSPTFPDLRGVRRGADGDYSKKDLEKVMNRNNMVGDVVGWWKRLSVDRPTLVYGVSIAHSIAMRDAFLKAGIKTIHLDGRSDDDQLTDAFAAFRNGQVKVLCCADLLTEGVDLPLCSCIQIVRPTKSLRLALQMYGRGLRPDNGTEKVDCVIIDHAGVVLYHGLPCTDIQWTINPDEEPIEKRLQREREEGKLPTPIICPKCFFMYQVQPACPQCGHKTEKKGRDIAMRPGTLVEVEGQKVFAPTLGVDYNKISMRCLATAANRGSTFSAASAIFKSQTGKMPWDCEGLKAWPPELPPEQQTNPDHTLYNWKAYVMDTYPKFSNHHRRMMEEAV